MADVELFRKVKYLFMFKVSQYKHKALFLKTCQRKIYAESFISGFSSIHTCGEKFVIKVFRVAEIIHFLASHLSKPWKKNVKIFVSKKFFLFIVTFYTPTPTSFRNFCREKKMFRLAKYYKSSSFQLI